MALAFCGLGFNAFAESNPDGSFELIERLGANWSKERVRFPLTGRALNQAIAGATLIDDAGRAVPHEMVMDAAGSAVEFLVDLPAFSRRSFRFALVPEATGRGVVVEEKSGVILLTNGLAGVAIRKGDQDGLLPAWQPIVAIQTPAGSWPPIETRGIEADQYASNSVTIMRRGPVAAVVRSELRLKSGLVWTVTVTLQADDPAVLIDEQWSDWAHPEIVMTFAADLPIDRFHFRRGVAPGLGNVADEAVAENGIKPFILEPWLRWWMSPRQGTWVAAYAPDAPHALVIGTRHADKWIEPGDPENKRALEPMRVDARDRRVAIALPGRGRERHWLIAVQPRDDAIDPSSVGKSIAPKAQRHIQRHSDFSLDAIKDQVLAWPEPAGARSRLMLSAADMSRLRGTHVIDAKERETLVKTPLSFFVLDRFLDVYLRSGDVAIGRRLSAASVPAMQTAVTRFLVPDAQMTLGFAPHHLRDLYYAAHLADIALADPYLTMPERERLRAQAAFLADVVTRRDFWSPERGFAANPNMTSFVAGLQGAFGCLLADHPAAPAWRKRAVDELFSEELLTWSDADGGWLEAPHYAMASYDFLLGVFACERNLGREDLMFHPRMRKVIEWLAKTSTPPDSRLGGARHLAPIGNTYVLEPTSQFGFVAQLWRDRDPVFAAQMQWMHEQSGRPERPGTGGFFPATQPYQRVLKRATLAAAIPNYGSEHFRDTGVILRAHFGTDRETQLHMIAGNNHAHYDLDSGSITLWGKGRVIADDFGYYGQAPVSDHSMLDFPGAANIMKIESFETTERVDRVRGRNGPWTRRIALHKDPDPLGANFFVLSDRLEKTTGGLWRLYFSADRIEIDPSGDRVRVIGREDVDTDIVFTSGAPIELKLETVTRTSASSGFDKPFATTQTALVAKLPADGAGIGLVIYPRLKTDRAPTIVVNHERGEIAITTSAGTWTVPIEPAR